MVLNLVSILVGDKKKMAGGHVGKDQQFSHPFGVCDRRLLGLICQGQDRAENVLREL